MLVIVELVVFRVFKNPGSISRLQFLELNFTIIFFLTLDSIKESVILSGNHNISFLLVNLYHTNMHFKTV